MKAVRFAALAMALAGLGLAGCNKQPNQPAAAPDAPAGTVVSNGRLVLPAVSGNPAAVYFDIANNGAADGSIVGVQVEGAKGATLHTTMQSGGMSAMKEMASIPLPKGRTVKFAPGGNHVMAKGLDASLTTGGTIEVTLTLATGDKVRFLAAIKAAGTEP